jgi:hypothetical protein
MAKWYKAIKKRLKIELQPPGSQDKGMRGVAFVADV